MPNVFMYLSSFSCVERATIASELWNMKCRPTMSELLASPLGNLSLAHLSNKAAELMAPQEMTTISPVNVAEVYRAILRIIQFHLDPGNRSAG
jgi:hypothetical protein